MMDNYDYQNAGSSLAAPKYHKPGGAPMPGRDELLARNSFGSPDNNKYLNASRRAEIAQKEQELAQLKRGVK